MDWIKMNWAYIIILGIYTVGTIGFFVPTLDGLWASLTPLNLLVGFAFVIGFHENKTKNFFFSLFLVGVLGFILEVIGVQTGKLFGVYTYGKNLGLKLFGTPLMIAINWALLIYLTNYIARFFARKNIVIAVVASVLMVGVDLLIEPFAIYYDLWSWKIVHVPIQNYITWFIISFVFHLLFNLYNIRLKNKIAVWLFTCLVLFFAIINLFQI